MKAYFFTNEKLASFLATDHFANLDRVFGIGGGGDFAFNLLALHSPKQIILCDTHPLAITTIREKLELISDSTHEKFLNFLISRKFSELKKSGHYYQDGFYAPARIDDFLPYLSSHEHYKTLQKTLDRIEVVQGDFVTELTRRENSFDLIYLSNLLETKHCQPSSVLEVCRSHLTDQGQILFAAQDSPKTVQRLLQKNSFTQAASEIHRFNTLQNVLGHYSYSFYLCKPL